MPVMMRSGDDPEYREVDCTRWVVLCFSQAGAEKNQSKGRPAFSKVMVPAETGPDINVEVLQEVQYTAEIRNPARGDPEECLKRYNAILVGNGLPADATIAWEGDADQMIWKPYMEEEYRLLVEREGEFPPEILIEEIPGPKLLPPGLE